MASENNDPDPDARNPRSLMIAMMLFPMTAADTDIRHLWCGLCFIVITLVKGFLIIF